MELWSSLGSYKGGMGDRPTKLRFTGVPVSDCARKGRFGLNSLSDSAVIDSGCGNIDGKPPKRAKPMLY